MSKPVKALLRNEFKRRLGGVDSLAVVSLAGVDGVANNRLRRDLLAKQIHLTVVKNAIARQALDEMGLGKAGELLDGPCALAYGNEGVVTIVRELLGRIKDVPALKVKGAFMEGEVFGADRVKELSKYPTREEAVARAVGLVLSPGSRLLGAILGPGGLMASLLEQIEDKAKAAEVEAAPAEAAPVAEAAPPAAEAPAGGEQPPTGPASTPA